jgi:hypothetical protein
LSRRLTTLAAAAAMLAAGTASAGILLEGDYAGQPLRLELGQAQGRALATVAGERYLVDLDRGDVYALDAAPARRIRAATLPDAAPYRPFALERWSEGPMVAGHGSTYHVLIMEERICGEVLASPWMTGFTEPLVRAVELLQRAVPGLAPRAQEGCGRIGFGTFASDGFPLMAGFKDKPVFTVSALRFDHHPAEAGFTLPAGAAD